jgi:anti-sigma factor RsiW
MNTEEQLKLQAFFDGELPEREARDTAAWVARDPEATAMLRELRNTRQALAQGAPVPKVPASREFYWSRIRQEIERLEQSVQAAKPLSFFSIVRRVLLPVGSAAALMLFLALAGVHFGFFGPSMSPDSEMTLANANAFTYRDFASGSTLVWVSFPEQR